MSDGPRIITTATLRCCGCSELDKRAVQTGRRPVFEHYCRHADAAGDDRRLIRWLDEPDGRFIGSTDVTPDWCPFRRGR